MIVQTARCLRQTEVRCEPLAPKNSGTPPSSGGRKGDGCSGGRFVRSLQPHFRLMVKNGPQAQAWGHLSCRKRESNSTRLPGRQSNQPSGLLLGARSHEVRNVYGTAAADPKLRLGVIFILRRRVEQHGRPTVRPAMIWTNNRQMGISGRRLCFTETATDALFLTTFVPGTPGKILLYDLLF